MNAGRSIAVVASVLVTMACSGGGSSAASSDLAGTWSVKTYEFVSTSNSNTKVDLIALGATATLVMRSDGTYQMTTKMGQADEIVTGSWTASSDVLTTTQTGMSGNMQFNYTVSASTLTLTGADSEWDFNGDGVYDRAKLNVTAVR